MYSPSSKLNLIGIAAPAQSGKSTVAAYLMKSLGYEEDSFADPMRNFVCTILGIDRATLERDKEVVVPWVGKSPRQMLQTLGTEWGRQMVDTDLWLNSCLRRTEGRRVVISDVRFDNEAQAIRDNGGTLIHLSRPDGRRTVADHISEAGVKWKKGDVRLINDSTLENLEALVAHWHYRQWKADRDRT
jgi:hypothetical protein